MFSVIIILHYRCLAKPLVQCMPRCRPSQQHRSVWCLEAECRPSIAVVVLQVIFTQFQYSDQSALPPDALRNALAKTFAGQHKFQIGVMDDAAECFVSVAECLRETRSQRCGQRCCTIRWKTAAWPNCAAWPNYSHLLTPNWKPHILYNIKFVDILLKLVSPYFLSYIRLSHTLSVPRLFDTSCSQYTCYNSLAILANCQIIAGSSLCNLNSVFVCPVHSQLEHRN